MQIHATLLDLVKNTSGVQHIWFADRDGVPIIGTGEDHRMRTNFIVSHQSSSEQTSKLDMGAHLSTVFFFNHYQLVILSMPPAVAFILADVDANTCQMMKLREHLEPVLEQIEEVFPNMP